ncbi:MAG TPA: SIS domain-containing protein [Pyrinomonadaceae bacterium]|nr:SIS domain-containing protein [Pyrinomonadaceae bacterium]
MKPAKLNVPTSDPSVLLGATVSAQSSVTDYLEVSAYSYTASVAELIRQLSPESIAAVAHQLNASRLALQTIFTMGNGGSATTALHMANDFSNATRGMDSKVAPRAICLNGNISLFSALANDLGYEEVFARQLRNLLHEGDVVIGISASGNSPNCVNGLKYARERGATTVGLLGFDGGIMKSLCDYKIHVPCNDYRLVEDVHLAISHALSFCLMNAAKGE